MALVNTCVFYIVLEFRIGSVDHFEGWRQLNGDEKHKR